MFFAPPSSASIAALLTLVQVAPVSVLRKRPFGLLLVNRRAGSVGSPARSNEKPAGKPVPAPPEIGFHVAPVSLLRCTPALLALITMMLPRAAMPVMLKLRRLAPPSVAQLLPPSVVRNSPS